MSQADAARTTRPKNRKARPVIILHNVPKGHNWGWYSREDPPMHLQTVDAKNRNNFKVWLERDSRRVFEPVALPAKLRTKPEAEVKARRANVEGRWVNLMIQNNWLTFAMHGSKITLTAYPGFPGARFTRTLDLADYLQGIYDPTSQMVRRRPVTAEEVGLNDEMAALEIWPQKDESLRYHISLPEILWQD